MSLRTGVVVFLDGAVRGRGVHEVRGGARPGEPGHLPRARQHGSHQHAAERTRQGQSAQGHSVHTNTDTFSTLQNELAKGVAVLMCC